MSLRSGPRSFSRDRIRSIWEDLRAHRKRDGSRNFFQLIHGSEVELPDRRIVELLCLGFYEDVKDPNTHLALLDSRYEGTCLPLFPNSPRVDLE